MKIELLVLRPTDCIHTYTHILLDTAIYTHKTDRRTEKISRITTAISSGPIVFAEVERLDF